MTNYERMMQLADEVFAMQQDPTQLQVDQDVLARLQRLHPNTRGEHVDGDGPVAWVLVIPTTTEVMDAFMQGTINEQQLFERTPEGGVYETIYLCSVMVLQEYRKQGLAQRLTLECIAGIRKDHPIKALFCWPFTTGGDALARAVARETGLPLKEREHVR